MKKVKTLALMLALSLLAGLAAGCGNASSAATDTAVDAVEPTSTAGDSNEGETPSGEKTTLTVVTAGGGFWDEPMAVIEEAFEASHPDIDLDIQVYGYEQLFQNVEVKLGAESDEYDVICVDFPMVASYTERGYIQPLDAYFTAEEQNLFVDSSRNASYWDGSFMAAPMESSAMLVFYNKDLIADAGVDFDPDVMEHPTWEELVSVSQQVMAANGDVSGISWEQVSRPYQVLPLGNTLGEKGIGDDGFTVDGVLNTDGWVQAMEFYADVFETGVSPRGLNAEEMSPMFYAGQMIFHIGGPWNLYSCYDAGFDFGYTLFPTFAGYEDSTATPTGSYHLGISSFSTNVDAAAEFIRFLTIGEGNDIWIAESGNVPALNASLEAILADEEAPETLQMCAQDVYTTGYARPVSPGYSEWENVVTNAFEDIRNGSNPESALDNAVQQIEQLFRKYQED